VARQAEEYAARMLQMAARRRRLSQSSDGGYPTSGCSVATAYGRLDSVSGEGEIRTVSDQATLVLIREDSSNFDYTLNVLTNEHLYLDAPVVNERHLQYNKANRTLAWAVEQSGSPVAFKFAFGSAQEATAFTIPLFIALVEHGRQESFDEAVHAEWSRLCAYSR